MARMVHADLAVCSRGLAAFLVAFLATVASVGCSPSTRDPASAAPLAPSGSASAVPPLASASSTALAPVVEAFDRYAADPAARAIALELYERLGDVAGVEPAHEIDGGFRGAIRVVPEPPVGPYRKHLAWARDALVEFDALFKGLEARDTVRYRTSPIALSFFRSVGRTTPSAYAAGWTVSYNVSGSLLGSADGVRETLFHEIFHLNDAAHGDWSMRVLKDLYDGIVARCGTRVACLRPYAPGDTMVRGGTYYAFQQNNGEGVREYAAELALRWYREMRDRKSGKGERAPFKCGPPENGAAWTQLITEFFGGADGTPPCR